MHFAFGTKLDDARNESKKCVVFAHTDVFARQDVRAALTDNNRAGLDCATLCDFDAEILWIRISTVFSCSRGLFMCHVVLKLSGMNIQELREKIKPYLHRAYIPILVLVLITILLAIWRLWALAQNRPEIKLLPAATVLSQTRETPQNGLIIGLKTTKKYYFPWCGALKRSKLGNQVQFDSAASARSAGYVAGGSCAGLQ